MTKVQRRLIKTYEITVLCDDSEIEHFYKFIGDHETCEIISARRV